MEGKVKAVPQTGGADLKSICGCSGSGTLFSHCSCKYTLFSLPPKVMIPRRGVYTPSLKDYFHKTQDALGVGEGEANGKTAVKKRTRDFPAGPV